MVILNSFNFVQFAHARHSSSKFGSALAQSQISGSVRGEVLILARSEILKQVQDDFGRFLLFLHPFWGSQFKIFVKNTHNSLLIAHYLKAQRRLEDAKPDGRIAAGF